MRQPGGAYNHVGTVFWFFWKAYTLCNKVDSIKTRPWILLYITDVTCARFVESQVGVVPSSRIVVWNGPGTIRWMENPITIYSPTELAVYCVEMTKISDYFVL